MKNNFFSNRQFLYLLILFISIMLTLSSAPISDRENQLLKKNIELSIKNDSLINHINNKLHYLTLEKRKIIENVLSISNDTSFDIINPNNIKELNNFEESQIKYFKNIKKNILFNWDSIINIPSGLPLPTEKLVRISDKYGYRKHPIINKWIFHDGIDLSAIKGTPIKATSNGIVVELIYSDTGYGNKVILEHQYGYSTLYAHLDEISVKIDQKIHKGDIIGTVGNTGSSTAPHLHYEIRHNNNTLNPIEYMDINLNIALN